MQDNLHYRPSQLKFALGLTAVRENKKHSLLIFDKRLLKSGTSITTWIERWPYRYSVSAGEKLKDLSHLNAHLGKILKVSDRMPAQSLQLVSLGGGSVGDFAGFVASIFRRGVPLIHIPSTWLAAIDSSHGGKTALNVDQSKNQVGTFYSARQIYMIRNLLFSQPENLARDAKSELIKMALIDGGAWSRRLSRSSLDDQSLLWSFSKPAVQAKYKVINKDPFEQTGARRVLNLGHTLGHILEAHYGISHGQAVGYGLHFAKNWSQHKKLLHNDSLKRVDQLLSAQLSQQQQRPSNFSPIPSSKFSLLCQRDKKRQSKDKLIFVFFENSGVTQKLVTISQFYREAKRQGWVK